MVGSSMRRVFCLAMAVPVRVRAFAPLSARRSASPRYGDAAANGDALADALADAVVESSDASQCFVDQQGVELLLRFGDWWEAPEEKDFAYDNLMLSPSHGRILDAALDAIDAAASADSVLGRRRWPVRLPSKRAALGCYARVLARLEGGAISAASPEAVYDGSEGASPRRGHLLNIIRELRVTRGIWSLEGALQEG